jgi:RNA polymerase sigma factor (sigma-70 family)
MNRYTIKTEQGDLITEEEVFHLLYPTLCLIAKRMLGNMVEAEDKASDAFTVFLERKEAFSEYGQVKFFLCRKVFEDCLSFLEQKKADGLLQEELKYFSASDKSDLMEEILRAEVTRHLDQLTNKLPPQQKKVYNYHCQPEPVATSWIARKLGIKKQSVRNAKNKTIKKLRKALKARGLIPIIIVAAIGIALYFLC